MGLFFIVIPVIRLGGDVKGIGLAGAVSVIEKDYEFVNIAGTSAGAIMAALLADDYTDAGVLDKIGFLGMGLSIGFEYRINEGKYFED